MMQRHRNLSFDVVRVLACLMVILMHSPMPGADVSGLVLSGLSLLCAPCIGLFFMVSGALLLPVKTSTGSFLRRRLGKVVAPTLCWTFFYLAVKWSEKGVEPTRFWQSICSIPFSPQGHGVLWFMYVLIGLYLIAPVLSPWLQRASRRELQFYLLLWGITLLYPILQMFLTVSQGETGALYYFTGYAGYFVLGYYLNRYSGSFRAWAPALLMLFPLVCAAACKLRRVEVDFYSVFWYLSVFVAMMCVAWFRLIIRVMRGLTLTARVQKWLVDFSNCSFGIYLVHIFVMRKVLWNCEGVLKMGGGYNTNSVNISADGVALIRSGARHFVRARRGVCDRLQEKGQ